MNGEANENDVICPYCGASYQAEACDFTDLAVEEKCSECGKIYLHWDECIITHHTRKKQEDGK